MAAVRQSEAVQLSEDEKVEQPEPDLNSGGDRVPEATSNNQFMSLLMGNDRGSKQSVLY